MPGPSRDVPPGDRRPPGDPGSSSDPLGDPLEAARKPVEAVLDGYLDEAVAELEALDPELGPVARAAAEFVRDGGKRLRPAFVHWGCAAMGVEPTERVYEAAAAVELLHAFALLHDDVMDRADVRRGRPALHHAMAAWHREHGFRGDAGWFGVGSAILAGDLVFVWSDRLFDRATSRRHGTARAREVFHQLRVEVMAGQFLDLRLAGLPDPTAGEVLRVALLKSGRYTVTRPLLLGAALADAASVEEVDGGRDDGGHADGGTAEGVHGGGAKAADVEAALTAYGDALGVAFQLRDDVLGLFGDEARTGKGALSDLREGKRTLLMLRALELGGARGRAVLEAALGDSGLDEAAADEVREVVQACGALAAVEGELQRHLDEAVAALAPLAQPARAALERLATDAAHRGA